MLLTQGKGDVGSEVLYAGGPLRPLVGSTSEGHRPFLGCPSSPSLLENTEDYCPHCLQSLPEDVAISSPAQGSGSSRMRSPWESEEENSLLLLSLGVPACSCTLAHVGRDQGRLWSVSKKRQNFLSLLQRTPLLSVHRLSATESPAPLLSLLRAVCLRLTFQLHLHRTPPFLRFTFLKVSSLYCLWLPLATCLMFPFPPFPAPASCSLFYSHWTRPAKG